MLSKLKTGTTRELWMCALFVALLVIVAELVTSLKEDPSFEINNNKPMLLVVKSENNIDRWKFVGFYREVKYFKSLDHAIQYSITSIEKFSFKFHRAYKENIFNIKINNKIFDVYYIGNSYYFNVENIYLELLNVTYVPKNYHNYHNYTPIDNIRNIPYSLKSSDYINRIWINNKFGGYDLLIVATMSEIRRLLSENNLSPINMNNIIIPHSSIFDPTIKMHMISNDKPMQPILEYIDNVSINNINLNEYIDESVVYIYFITRSANDNPYLILAYSNDIFEEILFVESDNKKFGNKNLDILPKLIFVKKETILYYNELINEINRNKLNLLYQVMDKLHVIYSFDTDIVDYFHNFHHNSIE